MSSDLVASVLAEAAKVILEKVKSGKKLAPEELILLMMDLVYNEVRETRRLTLEQIMALSRRLDEVYSDLSKRIEEVRAELSGRIEEVRRELGEKIDRVYRELCRRIDETNKRIDEVYKILAAGRTESSGS